MTAGTFTKRRWWSHDDVHRRSWWLRGDGCCGDLDLIVAMHGSLMGLGRQFAPTRWIFVALIIEYCVFIAGS